MASRIQGLAIIGVLTLSSVGAAAQSNHPAPERPPAPLDVIGAAPANRVGLAVSFVENHDGDGIGEELPSSITYYRKAEKDFGTSMTVTDVRLCTRPLEKRICQAFDRLTSGAPPALGTDVTGTRIGGSDYRTVFLAPIGSLEYPGVDRFLAFLGMDSQDLPLGDLTVYLYARKGSALIQLTAKVGESRVLVKPNETDVAYYRRNCVSEQTLRKAKSKGRELTELFRLER
jgi:hypothetical protein